MRSIVTTVSALAFIFAAIIPSGAPATVVAPVSEAEPGFYVTPPSTEFRRIVIHVGEDGDHVVGVNIKVPRVNCEHGSYLPHFRSASFLVPSEFITIVDHVGHENIKVNPSADERPGGRDGIYVHFTTPGTVEGRVSFRFIEKNREFGLCATTVRFRAKLKTT